MSTADGTDHGSPELWWLRERADELGIEADLAQDWRSTYAYVYGYQLGEEPWPGSRQRAEKLEAAAEVLRGLGELPAASDGQAVFPAAGLSPELARYLDYPLMVPGGASCARAECTHEHAGFGPAQDDDAPVPVSLRELLVALRNHAEGIPS